MFGQLQWNLSNLYTNGAEESVLRLKEWYLWWVKVSCLERCPHCKRVVLEVGKGVLVREVSSLQKSGT